MKKVILSARLTDRARNAFKDVIRGQLKMLEATLVPQMRSAAIDYTREMVRQTLGTTKLRQRSGALAKSLLGGVSSPHASSINDIRVTVTADDYAATHEYGATIKPKNKQWLTIPIGFGVRADGSPKRRNAASWSQYKPFVLTIKSTGNKFLVYKLKTGGLRFLYMLVDKVIIPKRLGLRQTFDRNSARLLDSWGQLFVAELSKLSMFDRFNAARTQSAAEARLRRMDFRRNFRMVRS